MYDKWKNALEDIADYIEGRIELLEDGSDLYSQGEIQAYQDILDVVEDTIEE